MEIFKVDGSALGLRVVDLNADGLADLVVANNTDGTIRLLYQRTAEDLKKADTTEKTELNVVSSDRRFRVEKIFTDKKIFMLAVGDLDSDGRPDLAYYSDPPELEVIRQRPTGGFGAGERREKFPIRDGAATPYGLRCGDLDGDGKLDLALLGRGKTYLLYQKKDGLAQPVTLHDSAAFGGLELADVDGNGLLDLVAQQPSSIEPVTVRLQSATGFGPEIRSRLQPIQSWVLGPLPGAPVDAGGVSAARLLTVQTNTRRIKGFEWRSAPTTAGLTRPRVIALGSGAAKDESRRLLADIDRDGRTDLVVGHPATAQIEVHFQSTDGSLSRRETYPTLAEVGGLASADVDGDGKSDLVVSSAKERAVGLSTWKGGRLEIPQTTPLEFEPIVLARRPFGLPGGGEGVCLVSQESDEDKTFLDVLRFDGGEASSVARVEIPARGSEPSDVRLLDIDGDGATDVLVFVPYKDPFVFRQLAAEEGAEAAGAGAKDGKKAPLIRFEEISRRSEFGRGQLSKLAPSAVSILRAGDKDARDRLLVAAGSYVRTLELDDRGRLRVVDQASARTSSAKLVAAARLDTDGDGAAELLALDAATNSLEILARGDGGSWKLAHVLELPKFKLRGFETADLDGNSRADLAIVGTAKVGVLLARETDASFVEALTHSVEQKDLGQPQDLCVGDLNADGAADLIAWTAPHYNLMLFSNAGDAGGKTTAAKADAESGGTLRLERQLSFPIFEEKSYMRRSTTLGPQQMIVADVDGDALRDLVFLIHDRILIYFQDSRR